MTWVGLKTEAGISLSVERLPDQVEPAGAVAHVKVHDAGLSRHQPADVGVAGDPEQLVQRRLAGAVVADRQLADAQDEVDQDHVAADAAGDRGRREVVAAGVALGAEPFRDEPRAAVTSSAGVRTTSSVPSTPTAVVTPPAVSRLRPRGGTRVCGPGLAAAAGEVDVAVDEAGNDAAALEVVLADAEVLGKLRDAGADPDDALAGHEQMHAAAGCGVVELGVEEEVEHGEKLPLAGKGGYAQ